MKTYYCYSCGCFDDVPCIVTIMNSANEVMLCPFSGGEASWEKEGQEMPYEECHNNNGCEGLSTTYKTEGGTIYFNCPDCGETFEIKHEDMDDQ